MYEYTKRFDSFDDLIDELAKSGHHDDVFNPVANSFPQYNDVLNAVMDYITNNKTGFFANDYPHCITFSVSSYGFRYIKNGIGLSFGTHCDRNNGNKLTYILGFLFDKPDAVLQTIDSFAFVAEDESYKYRYIAPREKGKKNINKSNND